MRITAFAGGVGVLTLSIALLGGGCSDTRERGAEENVRQTRAALAIATSGFNETTVISGRNKPTVVRFASDGRVFIAEKVGKIWVYDSLSDTTPTMFVDLGDRVQDFWDRGLLGMALDPAFPTKPYVYVLYSYDGDPGGTFPKWGDTCPTPPGGNADGCVISGRLSRLTATGNVAGPETVLVEGWRQQYPSHSMGQLDFGSDGALYASAGDGANFDFVDYGQDGSPLNPLGDPPVAVGGSQTPPSAQGGALRAQSPRRASGPVLLNGTLIRVDPATGAGLPDNPGAGAADANQKRVVAYGLRNPFRFATRPGKSELWIADVGWNDWEELNRLPLGGATALNFGWPCYEGAAKQAGYDGADLAQCESLYASGGHTPPFFAYAHSAGVSASDACGRGTAAVTGVSFYTGGSYPPAYNGALFFADYSRRCIYVMNAGASGDPDPTTARSFHTDADEPVFLTTGPGGDLFYAAVSAGTIQRISYREPSATATASPLQGQVPLIVSFDGSASVKADPADTLTYAWDLDGDGEFDDSSDAKPSYLYDTIGNYSARLKVSDQRGGFGLSAPLTIKVTPEGVPLSTPPEVFIDTPSAALSWKVGDKLEFSGHAVDAEDGPLPASALSWQVVIQHCPSGCHIHDLLSFDGVASGSFIAEDHEYPMHLELILTATDSSGERRSTRISLEPATVSLVFDTEPSGLALVVGATEQTTPFARRVIVGSGNTVSAAVSQTAGDTTWSFSGWSDGLARAHTLAPAASGSRYVASYVAGGLTGQYFNQLAFAGPSALTRIDPGIDFDWGMGSPAAGIDADTFSVRWTGEITADFAENYTFTTTSDDGVRLRIDGTSVIDHYNNHGSTVDTGKLTLSAGWHPIQLEYFDNTLGALIDLSWSSASQPAQIVPASHLRPACVGGACSAGLTCDASSRCTPACDASTCGSGLHCALSGPTCVSSCAGLTCPSSDVCRLGVCVDACSLVTCGVGQHCLAGSCIEDPVIGAGGAAGAGGAGGEAAAHAAGAASGGAAGDAGAPASDTGGAPASDTGGAPDSSGGRPDDENAGDGGRPATSGGRAASGGTETVAMGGTPGSPTPRSEGGASSDPAPSSDAGGARASDSASANQDSSSCSCRVAGASRAPGHLALAAVGLLAFARRRRRAESQTSCCAALDSDCCA